MHKIKEKGWSEKIFKAYDIRGKFPDEINEDAVYKIARAFARYLKLGKENKPNIKILISSDARTSSPALKEALTDGLQDEGVEIIDAGITTTPMHYFAVNVTEADGGAMITASHNPAQFNGLKLTKKGAVPIGEGFGMDEIKNDALRGIFAGSQAPDPGKVIERNLLDEYLNFFEAKFIGLKKFDLKVTACGGNGMASILLDKLFAKFPKITPDLMHTDIDMTFPNHEANPLKAENLRDVQDAVIKNNSDIGISFDGDGDRVGFVDEKGSVIPGDIVTALLARRTHSDFLALNPLYGGSDASPKSEHVRPAIIYDLRSSRIVREEIGRLGMRALESRVGHAFIKSLMRKENAALGGEVSGHYYFRDFYYCDSAVFAALSVMDLMRIENKKLSKLVSPLLKYSKSEEINFEIKNKDKILDKIAAHFADGKASYLDGIKVDYPDWWFNIRLSNTEDLVRLNIEAATPELMEEKKKLISELLG